ncbi:uncharacterized protein LOC135699758 [Ochlerotatus camptorhynchus]|uniref:uncharacterized protein LOC135699758 n=1 Tax=Ochlerotatus camptorhynchus TaxID=644619 RepID=UPI0031D59D26
MHKQGYRMEQISQISTSSSGKQSHHTLPGTSIRPLGLLLLVCLLASMVQVSARPSDAAKPVAMVSSSDRSNPASIPHRNLKRRSAEEHDYGDYFDEEYLHIRRCYEDEDVNELCQRCSKVTKSAIVFPMCCSNEDETMDWCKAYVYYGIQN